MAIMLTTPISAAQDLSVAGVPILAYHRFDPKTPASTTVTLDSFESQISALSKQGYSIVPLDQVVNIVLRKIPAPNARIAAITVDDGHRSVYTVLFPIIRQRHIPVTLFVYPSAISNSSYALTWEQLKEMHDSGFVDIQSHTYWHPNFRTEKSRRTPNDYAAFVNSQLDRSRHKLEEELGIRIDLLAWPYGISDTELTTAAGRAGYRAAFGYAGGVARAGDNAFSIHRIPVPDSARGRTFEALLRYSQTHPEGSSANAGHE